MLGKFGLEGIPSAPRGVPQIEVTFDIDANGIVNVSARDKATGKEQKITITASSGLSDGDIDRMVKDAKEHESEDKARREAIDKRNQLESLVLSVEKHLEENREKIPETERTSLESALKEGRETLDQNKEPKEASVFAASFDKLQAASHKMAEALYKAAGGTDGAQATAGSAPNAGATKKPDDDVIDAEYTEN